MRSIELLQSIWAPKVQRQTELIVPEVTYSDLKGSLNNNHWFFNVPYAFRDALDLKHEERKKNKKPYMVWTQGPIIGFKEGDLLISNCEKWALKVKYASPMGWDISKNAMYQGSVTHEVLEFVDGSWKLLVTEQLNQMEFLALLISGESPHFNRLFI